MTYSLCIDILQLLLAVLDDLSSAQNVGMFLLGCLAVHLNNTLLALVVCCLQ